MNSNVIIKAPGYIERRSLSSRAEDVPCRSADCVLVASLFTIYSGVPTPLVDTKPPYDNRKVIFAQQFIFLIYQKGYQDGPWELE